MAEGARLESVYTVTPYRGFESLPLRHLVSPIPDKQELYRETARFWGILPFFPVLQRTLSRKKNPLSSRFSPSAFPEYRIGDPPCFSLFLSWRLAIRSTFHTAEIWIIGAFATGYLEKGKNGAPG